MIKHLTMKKKEKFRDFGFQIQSLEDWTHLSTNEFLQHYMKRIRGKWLFSGIDRFEKLRIFDTLTNEEKRKIVDFVENEQPTVKEKITEFFTKIS
jgi:hypothetical protein